jgi:hypothetical protein
MMNTYELCQQESIGNFRQLSFIPLMDFQLTMLLAL